MTGTNFRENKYDYTKVLNGPKRALTFKLSANFVYDLPFLTLRNEAVHLLFKTTP